MANATKFFGGGGSLPVITHLTQPTPPYVAGQYYPVDQALINGTTAIDAAAIAPDLLVGMFFTARADFTFDRIGWRNTTTDADNIRLGTFSLDDGDPTSWTLIQDAGVVTLGGAAANNSWTVSFTVEKGKRYCIAAVSDGNPTMASWGTPSGSDGITDYIDGSFAFATAISDSWFGMYGSHTYGALPSTFTPTSALNGTSRKPYFQLWKT